MSVVIVGGASERMRKGSRDTAQTLSDSSTPDKS